MDKLTLTDALKSNSITLTLGEIEAIMDEELAKGPEEMDTELIDLCAEALENAYLGNEKGELKNSEKKKGGRRKSLKLTRALLIAAIVTLILSAAIPVSAKYIHNEASDRIVQFFIDHFKINLRGNAERYSDERIDLVKELHDGGFENVILPSVLLSDEWEKSAAEISEDEAGLYLSGYSKLEFNDISGYIDITYHKTELSDGLLGKNEMGQQYDEVKQLTANGMDIAVFYSTQYNNIAIRYVDGRTDYSIQLDNCDLETGVKIAESLG